MKNRLIRIIVAGVIFLCGIITFVVVGIENFWANLVVFLVAYLIAGYDVLLRAIKNILRGKIFDENFLMAIASVGAFAIQEFPEAAAVILFYQVGELFQDYSVSKSRRSIAALMEIRPEYANLLLEDGTTVRKDPEDIKIGDKINVVVGERIPLDGIIIKGSTALDTSALSGESIPRDVAVGDEVLSGSINKGGVITVEVTKVFGESTVNKILELVENSGSKKSKTENFITKFARYYTPAVVAAAVLLAVLPPLIFSAETFSVWIYRALSFLVVSCPCALVVSVPMAFFGGIGGASKRGILIKGGNYLEVLAKTETVVFDKTGTLTEGIFKVRSINPIDITADELLRITAYAEYYSNHPISLSIKNAYGIDVDVNLIGEVEERAGEGVVAEVDGRKIYAGNKRLMNSVGAEYYKGEIIGTAVHVSQDDKYLGHIIIADEIKADAHNLTEKLKKAGVKKTVLLTGDTKATAEAVAKKICVDEVYYELLPADKVEKLENLLNNADKNSKIAFVGDGINDAPVLARADVGIAMGGLGSDAAIEAADIVIMTDEPSKIIEAKKIAKKTLRISTQNIIFALAVKAAVLILSAIGITNMWVAVFADVGVAFLAILNSFRALRAPRNKDDIAKIE